MTEKQYDDIEFNFWKAEKENDFIAGIYTALSESVGENKQTVYHLKTEDGLRSVWGCTVLNDKMKLVEIGKDIKIIYLGKKDSGKRKYHEYKVQVAKEE